MSAHASRRIPVLKQRIDARIAASGLASYNAFGMIATEAAWRTGEAWLDALLPYLAGNRDMLEQRIERAAPGARSMRLDATYLGVGRFFRHRIAGRGRRRAGQGSGAHFRQPR